jgi:NTE family protein
MPDCEVPPELPRDTRNRPQQTAGARFESIALLLQGGGALGAYQAGVYEALTEANLQPDWIAGISIGSINAALIAGNPPEKRVEALRKFWNSITTETAWERSDVGNAAPKSIFDQAINAFTSLGAMTWAPALGKSPQIFAEELRSLLANYRIGAPWTWSPDLAAALGGDHARGLTSQLSAGAALINGAPGFFRPRLPLPWFQPSGTVEATSYYDSQHLKSTLEQLVDFDRINDADMRLSLGAVNVATGNFVYFDNTARAIRAEHIMASGALPPGFPAVEIDGEYYWDGGLVSNTPLSWVLDAEPRRDTLAFQVDLWSARGELPRTMAEVMTRQKEIQYSSRTRANTDGFKYVQKLRNALSSLIEKLPDELKESPEVAVLSPASNHKVYNLIQLVYRSKRYEGDSKDYDFSRASMEEHWLAGYHDTVRTLRHPEVLERPKSREGVFTFDLAYDGRE